MPPHALPSSGKLTGAPPHVGCANMESVMLKTISAATLAVAVVGFAGAANAACAVGPWGANPTSQQIDAQNYCVDVNIQVEDEVSMWANHDDISLVMDGADGNNSATFASSLSVLNNVNAKVDAVVTGSLPTPSVPGGGINFFIFKSGTAIDAVAAITANAYTPANAAVWNQASLGTTKNILSSTGVNTSIANKPIVYASAAPGELPLPNSYDLEVVYTISALPTP